jgi:hypothetical protein
LAEDEEGEKEDKRSEGIHACLRMERDVMGGCL